MKRKTEATSLGLYVTPSENGVRGNIVAVFRIYVSYSHFDDATQRQVYDWTLIEGRDHALFRGDIRFDDPEPDCLGTVKAIHEQLNAAALHNTIHDQTEGERIVLPEPFEPFPIELGDEVSLWAADNASLILDDLDWIEPITQQRDSEVGL